MRRRSTESNDNNGFVEPWIGNQKYTKYAYVGVLVCVDVGVAVCVYVSVCGTRELMDGGWEIGDEDRT